MIAVGSLLGWVASILSRSDTGRGIAFNVALGLAAALSAGALASKESLLIGLSGKVLLMALVATAIVLAGYNIVRVARSG